MKFEELLKRIDPGDRARYMSELLSDRDTEAGRITGLESRFVQGLMDLEAQDAVVEALKARIAAVDDEAVRASLGASLTEAVFAAEHRRAMLEAIGSEVERIKDRLEAIKSAGV